MEGAEVFTCFGLITWVSCEWFCVPCSALAFHSCLFHCGQRKGGKKYQQQYSVGKGRKQENGAENRLNLKL